MLCRASHASDGDDDDGGDYDDGADDDAGVGGGPSSRARDDVDAGGFGPSHRCHPGWRLHQYSGADDDGGGGDGDSGHESVLFACFGPDCRRKPYCCNRFGCSKTHRCSVVAA